MSLLRWLKLPIAMTVAAGLVGVAIVLDGSGARALNGIGGMLWIASCIAMIRARMSDPRRLRLGSLVFVMAILLAVVVRPSDGDIAVLGFGFAAGVIALIAASSRITWCVLLPALWLPVHLGIAIGKVMWRGVFGGETAVRTDPPPTAALVPLLMVLTAWGVGLLVTWLNVERARRNNVEVRPI